MQEWVKKSDVEMLLSMPQDILSERIHDLKGVWVDNNGNEADFDDEAKHYILQKHIGILKTLNNEGVLYICYDTNSKVFYIRESCDEWFTHKLTKADCVELSELFKELSEVIDE